VSLWDLKRNGIACLIVQNAANACGLTTGDELLSIVVRNHGGVSVRLSVGRNFPCIEEALLPSKAVADFTGKAELEAVVVRSTGELGLAGPHLYDASENRAFKGHDTHTSSRHAT
jgi:hypothetical protein